MAQLENRARWPALVRALPLVPVAAVLAWSGAAAAEHVARDADAAWRALGRVLAAIAEVEPMVRAAPDAGVGGQVDAGRAPARVTHAPRDVRAVAPPTRDEILDEVRAAFCPALAEGLCGARERCGCARAEPRCRDRVEEACSDHLARAFAEGSEPIELAPDVLAACLAGFAALGEHCDLDRAVMPGCAWPVREPVEIGAACEVERDLCRGGACGERVCVAPGRRGEAPTVAGCEPGLVDLDARCEAPHARGTACAWDRECAPDLVCWDGRCTAWPGLHESCPLGRCATGLRCDHGPSARLGSCVAGATWCTDASQCGTGHVCNERFACGPCASGGCDDPTVCGDGTRCAAGTECALVDAGRCEPQVCLERSLVDLVD